FVGSEAFTLTVSASHGRVIEAVIRDESFRAEVGQIDRFDVEDVREWVEGFRDEDGIEGQTLEFPVIGHWKKDGTYVAPDQGHRIDIE
ncbi:hypothetical protein KC221_25570, partial [Mycobacterium tuberculosis]|nr:hypothetical protein [Mycobacterium tuberculosis]